MKRFVAIAVAILFAASVVAMGMGDTGLHPGSDGEMHMTKTAVATAQEPADDLDGPGSDNGTLHLACAVGGHSCSGFIVPELGVSPQRSTDQRDWAVIVQRIVPGLSPEATAPPPRA